MTVALKGTDCVISTISGAATTLQPALASAGKEAGARLFVPSEWAGVSAGKTSGLGGGLREVDRRASWCKKGMGENIGVEGVEEMMLIALKAAVAATVDASLSGIGNASHVEVTTRVRSTARMYFPGAL